MIIIIMIIFSYKNSKSIMKAACYKSDNDNKFDNNKKKVYLLLRK